MQGRPQLAATGVIRIDASNKSQQRGPHGSFRYFGKLAPDVTRDILDRAADALGSVDGPLVDLMCGSGTTLIEAADRDWASVGVDVNPVACLYSRVKTRSINRQRLHELLFEIEWSPLNCSETEIQEVFGGTLNADRWFSRTAQEQIAALRHMIGILPDSRERDLLLATLLSRLRRASNASARTGRIFYDPQSAVNDVRRDFLTAALAVADRTPPKDLLTEVITGDARATGLPDAHFQIVFCHPPYFGLYRFSADVLRFELEIGGWSRRSVAEKEVEEGWKSGDRLRLDTHVADMSAVFREAHRISRTDGAMALVASNSTLGDHQLPVVDRLADVAYASGWRLHSHLERLAHFGSATYHKSARSDKVISRDHVLLFLTD